MMNKQQALCLSLVSLLMSPAYSVAMEKAGGNGANPVSVAVMLAAGAVTTAAGYQSIESIKGMLKDIENGKQQETSLDEDLRNCAKVVGLCTGLVGLGGAFMRDGDTPTYMQGTLGSSVIAGSLFYFSNMVLTIQAYACVKLWVLWCSVVQPALSLRNTVWLFVS